MDTSKGQRLVEAVIPMNNFLAKAMYHYSVENKLPALVGVTAIMVLLAKVQKVIPSDQWELAVLTAAAKDIMSEPLSKEEAYAFLDKQVATIHEGTEA